MVLKPCVAASAASVYAVAGRVTATKRRNSLSRGSWNGPVARAGANQYRARPITVATAVVVTRPNRTVPRSPAASPSALWTATYRVRVSVNAPAATTLRKARNAYDWKYNPAVVAPRSEATRNVRPKRKD